MVRSDFPLDQLAPHRSWPTRAPRMRALTSTLLHFSKPKAMRGWKQPGCFEPGVADRASERRAIGDTSFDNRFGRIRRRDIERSPHRERHSGRSHGAFHYSLIGIPGAPFAADCRPADRAGHSPSAARMSGSLMDRPSTPGWIKHRVDCRALRWRHSLHATASVILRQEYPVHSTLLSCGLCG